MSPLLILLLIALLLAFFLLPLQFEVVFTHDRVNLFRITPALLGIKKNFIFRIIRTQGHHEVQYISNRGAPHRISPEKLTNPSGMHLIQRLWHAVLIRRYLLRHIRRFHLHTDIVVHSDDAAAIACITGCANVLGSMVHAFNPNIQTRIIPGFSHRHPSIRARCIFSIRLGTIFITSVWLLLHTIRQQFQRNGR